MTKRERSALPLPRYVLRKVSAAGVRFYFNLPAWARAQGCPLHNEPLGTDYDVAVRPGGNDAPTRVRFVAFGRRH